MRRARAAILIALLGLLSAPVPADEDVPAKFTQANDLYAEGRLLANQQKPQESAQRFQQAAQLYEQILGSGFVSWPVLYNLGNAYYRHGRVGKAILNYRRAERLAPRNAEIKANIKQAQQQTKDRHASRELPSFFRSLLFCYYGLSLNEATVLAAVLYFAFCIAEILFIFQRRPLLKRATIVLLLLTLITATSLVLKIRNEDQTPTGIVIAQECPVRIGPGKEYNVLFKAHEGADVVVLGERADAHSEKQWLRVKVLIETVEQGGKEAKRIVGPEGYALSSNIGLL